MPWLTYPTSFLAANRDKTLDAFTLQDNFSTLSRDGLPPHSSHPNFAHLMLLVLEAVLEVVFVSLPGYIVARNGMFDAEAQKFVANLNVMVFTPCLVFTKLASQLTADKLVDLAIIPFIFVAQTLVSYLCATAVSGLFRFSKREKNFVTAMGVFGNSNSLPISLVLSLSQTISGLHWDQVPGDNDDEVAARGILYLLIFQQLGQLLRWSWGYNVLLAPAETYEGEDENHNAQIEGGYRDDEDDEDSNGTRFDRGLHENGFTVSEHVSAQRTSLTHQQSTNSLSSKASSADAQNGPVLIQPPMPVNPPSVDSGRHRQGDDTGRENDMASTPTFGLHSTLNGELNHKGLRAFRERVKTLCRNWLGRPGLYLIGKLAAAFRFLPLPAQKTFTFIYRSLKRFILGVWAFMNPPLWAMLTAIIVASVPALQRLCFEEGTFVNNSVISAISQSGGVAVPLILVVLGANLARNTLPKDKASLEDPKVERKLLIASLISRMLLPIIIMAPLLAVAAKYVPISILDDPIFVIVCFLLTGAPSALQLAQICQINNVYMGAVSKLLFQSYVVWILPSTLVLVMCALEVVEWAQGLY